jgi:signal peptidase
MARPAYLGGTPDGRSTAYTPDRITEEGAMEIAPVPQRRVWTTRAWVVIVLILFAPVTVLTLVPTMFGLERYVMSSDEMGGALDRGSVVFERVVPVSDLEVGDVVTFQAPADSGHTGLVTHRIVDIKPRAVHTQADDSAHHDPVVVSTNERATMSRVVFAIPYVGLPFLLSVGTWMWLAVLLGAAGTLMAFLLPAALRRRHARQAASRVGEFAG